MNKSVMLSLEEIFTDRFYPGEIAEDELME